MEAFDRCPVLVFGSGQRCGSTLVQRLICSHPRALVWGENGGNLRDVLRASDTLRLWDQGKAVQAREDYEALAHQGWIASLLPGPEAVTDAARAYVRALFADPAEQRGRPLWGFKEVRFGLEEARQLRELFPGTRVIHVTRDPRDMLISLDWWERAWEWWERAYTLRAVKDWLAINESFLAGGKRSWVESWRYEDLVSDPDGFCSAVSRLLALDPGDLDISVFERRVTGNPGEKRKLRPFRKLPPELRTLVDGEDVRRVAAAYGYALD